ncbi:hypothetical protein NG895_00485 [Aeoliella sp. ICT_H6.2]|uniref:Uncharacterized protein n=1 Tax=Aeoliella straminimaris TaxID=2954799 RepID=A0A9X2JE78_9BACT|nr:hypothetical protein [Aeoliella straminimaris]MCO6042371.1 hypothetical protein [Aeoliella straminimaris]
MSLIAACTAQAEPVWRMFMPTNRVESNVNADYTLSQESGPWMVMAATFSGSGAEQQARELVLELRKQFNLEAYHHSMTFQHTGDERLGRGLDRYGAPLRMRYQSGEQSQEHAVLVGNFPAIDDPAAQKLLDQVKKLRPKTLDRDYNETSQNLAIERDYYNKAAGGKGAAPMSKAFLTRNPILPEEYFNPKGVDPFVAKMNAGVEHSVLDCPERYTVKVATFRGKAVLQGAFSSGSKSRNRNSEPDVDPLVEAALNAHRIVVFLRAKGWEAYEFHDRTESYVTIGSFDKVANRTADGQLQPTGDVDVILRTFGAAYKTPSALSVGANVPMQDRMRAEEVKRKFNNLFSNQHGQIATGLEPKYIEYTKNKFVPLDITPEVIEAPRKSITSAYAWGR